MEAETLTMKDRKKISRQTAQRYQRAGKKEKGEILEHFVSLTEYSRCYASWILRNWGKQVIVYSGRKRIILVGEWKGYGKTSNRKGKRTYGEKVQEALKRIWYIERVLRGGSWYCRSPVNCCSAVRNRGSPTHRYDPYGFRCAASAAR